MIDDCNVSVRRNFKFKPQKAKVINIKHLNRKYIRNLIAVMAGSGSGTRVGYWYRLGGAETVYTGQSSTTLTDSYNFIILVCLR